MDKRLMNDFLIPEREMRKIIDFENEQNAIKRQIARYPLDEKIFKYKKLNNDRKIINYYYFELTNDTVNTINEKIEIEKIIDNIAINIINIVDDNDENLDFVFDSASVPFKFKVLGHKFSVVSSTEENIKNIYELSLDIIKRR